MESYCLLKSNHITGKQHTYDYIPVYVYFSILYVIFWTDFLF